MQVVRARPGGDRSGLFRSLSSIASAPVTVAGVSRDRITVDLGGLGPALRAHAQDRQLTVAAAARSVLASALQNSARLSTGELGGEPVQVANQAAKLTLRLRRGAADRLATRARAAGLSYGAYLATLLDGTPAPPLAPGHDLAVKALGVSTEQLAVLSADVNELIRLIRRESVPAARQFSDPLVTLVGDVRQHLVLASRLMVELQPAARLRQRSGKRPDHWQRTS